MQRLRQRTFIVCACLLPLLGSCSLLRKTTKPETPPTTQAPRLVGRIASVPAHRKFVLIQSYGPWNIDAGAILTTRGPENRHANLLTTGESLGQFAAADIQSGHVEVGDPVYSQPAVAPSTPPPGPGQNAQPTEKQPQTPTQSVQKNN